MSATTKAVTSIPFGNPSSIESGRRIPGDGHMWFMVIGDLIVFGAYFIIYMFDRSMSPEAYVASQRLLSVDIGVMNTIVLLTSSLFAALAVIYTRHGLPKAALRMIYATGLCGVLFALIKVYEWQHMAQYASVYDEFVSYYFVLTGCHLFHVFVGLLFLGVVAKELKNPRKQRVGMVEQGTLFWHMVDLIWLFIFPMLYLM